MSDTRLDRKIIRLKVDATSFTDIEDVYTKKTPKVWQGNACRFELGIFKKDTVADISNIALIYVEIFDSTRTTIQASASVSQDSFNQNLTAEEWVAGTALHAEVEFSEEQMNLSISSGNEQAYWVVISAYTNDTTQKIFTLAGTTITVVKDGTGDAGDPPEPVEDYYNETESDARFVQKAETDAEIRFVNGRIYIYNATTGKFNPIVNTGAEGAERIGFGPAESF